MFYRLIMNSVLPDPEILLDLPPTPEIPLPKGWTKYTLQTILYVIAFARIVILNAPNWPDGIASRASRFLNNNQRHTKSRSQCNAFVRKWHEAETSCLRSSSPIHRNGIQILV